MAETLVVDLCGTLVRENTTHGFMRAARLPRANKLAARLLLSRPGFALSRLITAERHRRWLLRCLRGASRRALSEDAARYARKALTDSPTVWVIDEIRAFQARGLEPCIASASIDVVVQAFAEQLGIRRWVCTRIDYTGDVCLGEIADDATGRKLALLERELGKALHPFRVITDNAEDQDLVAVAASVTVIGHDAA